MLKVYCDVRKCTSCRLCETACAARNHSGEGNLGAIPERLPTSNLEQLVSGRLRPFALRCGHCTDSACVGVCPTGAIQTDPTTGNIVINRDRCNGCWECVKVCVSSAIVTDLTTGKALKCDLCEAFESPTCVDACPSHALQFEETDDFEEAVCVNVIRG